MIDKKDAASATEQQLINKYGSAIFDHPPSITRSRLERKLARRDALDQHFTKAWVDFANATVRPQKLDQRTRFLVQIGQFTVTKSHSHLEDVLHGAISAGVAPREALEVILHCHIYGGDTVLEPALVIFTRVAEELGVLAQLREGQLPLDGHDSERSFEAERKTWPPGVEDDPRREDFMRRHGWMGINVGIKYRGKHHLDMLHYRDAIDPTYAGIWLKFAYQNVYNRGVLDDKTRMLCTSGDCIALGEAIQAREHMVEAMVFGASAGEVLEIILMSALNFGFPRMGSSLRVFVGIMAEQGRLAEIGDPPFDPQARAAAAKK